MKIALNSLDAFSKELNGVITQWSSLTLSLFEKQSMNILRGPQMCFSNFFFKLISVILRWFEFGLPQVSSMISEHCEHSVTQHSFRVSNIKEHIKLHDINNDWQFLTVSVHSFPFHCRHNRFHRTNWGVYIFGCVTTNCATKTKHLCW